MSTTERPTPEQLAAIRERCAAAPEGPWQTYPNPMRDDGVFVAQEGPLVQTGQGLEGPHSSAVPKGWSLGHQVPHATGEFIAHARADVPALLRWLEQAQKRETLLLESIGHARTALKVPYTQRVPHLTKAADALPAALPTEGD